MQTSKLNSTRARRLGYGAIALLLTLSLAVPQASAQRPDTTELLPDATLVFVRIPSIPELVERWNSTSSGRLFNDEQVRPLFESLYETASDEFAQNAEEQVGLSLEELTKLPQGEVTFAMVEQNRELSSVLFVDVSGQLETAQTLLGSGERIAENEGQSIESETIGDVDLRIVNDDACYFIRDEVVCISDNPETARSILARWDGTSLEKRFFDTNRKYVTIMGRCRTVDNERPQLEFFVDPIGITKANLRGSVSGAATYAFMSTIGLDGFLGVGGTMTMVTEKYDSVMHLHALISNPREGVMKAIAMKPGDIAPQAWVPRNVITYNTVNWDALQTYDAVAELVDGFTGEGATEKRIEENFNTPLEIDFQEDVLAQLQGRLTYVQWLQEPVSLNSQTILVGVELNDAEEAEELIQDLLERFDEDERFEKVRYKDAYYYTGPENDPNAQFRRNDDGEFERYVPEDRAFDLRKQQPTFAFVGNDLLLSDSRACIEAAIDASEDSELSLQSDPDFEIIDKEIRRLVGSNFPGAIFYSRPEESMRFIFELARGDGVKNILSQGAEEQPVVGRIRDSLEENPLPAFEDLEEYLAPGGGVITNDESGLHLMFFGLRR